MDAAHKGTLSVLRKSFVVRSSPSGRVALRLYGMGLRVAPSASPGPTAERAAPLLRPLAARLAAAAPGPRGVGDALALTHAVLRALSGALRNGSVCPACARLFRLSEWVAEWVAQVSERGAYLPIIWKFYEIMFGWIIIQFTLRISVLPTCQFWGGGSGRKVYLCPKG